MGCLKKPLPVKFFIGMLSNRKELFAACEEHLIRQCGPVDLRSEIVPWVHSDYYRSEMGTGLFRIFVFLENLGEPGHLPLIKQNMIALEKSWSRFRDGEECREINIDPGYLTEAKVVLSTTKDYAHRMYIGGNVYAEVELTYRKDAPGYVPLEHTYPDFRNVQTIGWFNKAREILHGSLLSNGDLKNDRTLMSSS